LRNKRGTLDRKEGKRSTASLSGGPPEEYWDALGEGGVQKKCRIRERARQER